MDIYESKTKKHKIVSISDDLLKRLPRGVALGNYDSYAFPSSRSSKTHINRSTYHRHLKRVCEALRVDFSAHSTRKLYAQNMFDITEDINDVQRALQHEYINTTAKYLDVDLPQIINAELRARKYATQSGENKK